MGTNYYAPLRQSIYTISVEVQNYKLQVQYYARKCFKVLQKKNNCFSISFMEANKYHPR